jgi:hypothetical protein
VYVVSGQKRKIKTVSIPRKIEPIVKLKYRKLDTDFKRHLPAKVLDDEAREDARNCRAKGKSQIPYR